MHFYHALTSSLPTLLLYIELEDLPASKKRKLENGEEVADEAAAVDGEEAAAAPAEEEQGDVEMTNGGEEEAAATEEPKDGETAGKYQ